MYLHLLDPEIPIDYMRLYGCIWIFYGIILDILCILYGDIVWDYHELYVFIWGINWIDGISPLMG